MSNLWKVVVWLMAWPKEVRPYFIASVKESYTIEEIRDILRDTQLSDSIVSKSWYGLKITGRKHSHAEMSPGLL